MRKKIHPNSFSLDNHLDPLPAAEPTILTVWRKSLLLNCNGFTVFDSKGNLVFRVDNYSKSGTHGEILLMDAAGKPCLTIRRKKKLFLGEQWRIYEGETTLNPIFSIRKHTSFFQSKSLARVSPRTCNSQAYEVEGSYRQRKCSVLDEKRHPMVQIQLKEPINGADLGLDVFRLVVHPNFDPAFAMAIVILLEEMIGSKP